MLSVVSVSVKILCLLLAQVPIPVHEGLLQLGSEQAAPLRAQSWYAGFAAWFSDAVDRDHCQKMPDRFFSSSVGFSGFNLWFPR